MSQIYSKPINVATSGDTIIVAKDAKRPIRVLAFSLFAGGTTTAQFFSGPSTTTPLTGPYPLKDQGQVTSPFAAFSECSGQMGLFETLPNNDLVLTLGGNIQVSGFVTYMYDNP
jgi:hypothetical protein